MFAPSRSTKPIDAGWTGSLKVAVTLAVIETPLAAGAGDELTMPGGWLSPCAHEGARARRRPEDAEHHQQHDSSKPLRISRRRSRWHIPPGWCYGPRPPTLYSAPPRAGLRNIGPVGAQASPNSVRVASPRRRMIEVVGASPIGHTSVQFPCPWHRARASSESSTSHRASWPSSRESRASV